MNFDFTGEEKQIRSRLTSLLEEWAKAEMVHLEQAGVDENRELVLGFLSRLAETGYLAADLDEPRCAQWMSLMAAREALARFSASLFLAVEASTRLFGSLVAAARESEINDRILGPLREGRIVAAVGLTDEGDPQDRSGIPRTVARMEGSQLIVTGRKPFVTNGPIADWVAVVAELEQRPAVCFLQREQPGLRFGPRQETLGFGGLTVCALELDEVRVMPPYCTGPLQDDRLLTELRLSEDLILAQLSVGLMQRTFEAAKTHAKIRQRGGKPILHYQEIGFKLAEMLTLLQTAQLLTYRTAWLWSSGSEDAPTLIRCAKVFAAEAAETVASAALQIGGGHAYVSGNPIEQGYRESKYAAVAGTTSEICRMAIAQELIKQHPI